MCVNSFNLVNQKIFWIVFVLYMALTVWTGLSLVGHVLLKFVPELRSAVIWTQMPRVSEKTVTVTVSLNFPKDDMDSKKLNAY